MNILPLILVYCSETELQTGKTNTNNDRSETN
jgi:hypothetical protein